ncbi:MAG: 3'-5' exonuclease [Thermoflexales bacterium]|nr:3'-5' exonuclease [Thermoflexales bacterium]
MKEHQLEAVRVAREWLARTPIFIDTETTDLNGEACDIGIVDVTGEILLNMLVRPSVPISAEASAIHHITNEMVRDAPTFLELFQEVNAICAGRLIVAYNAKFDYGVFQRSALAAGVYGDTDSFSRLPTHDWGAACDTEVAWESDPWKCAMLLYAQFQGTVQVYKGQQSFKWWKQFEAANHLGIAVPADLHRAAADAALTRQIVLAMSS